MLWIFEAGGEKKIFPTGMERGARFYWAESFVSDESQIKNGADMPCADKTVIWENYKIGICQAGLDNKTGGTQLRLSAACFCAAMGRKSHPVPRRSVRWSHCHFLSDSLRQASFASIHFIQNYSRSSKTDERRQWSRWTAAPLLTSVRLYRLLANKAAVAAE